MSFSIVAKMPGPGQWFLNYDVVEVDRLTGVAPCADVDGYAIGPRVWETREEAEQFISQLTGRLRGPDTTHHTGV
jgi:hypothetical protein